MSLPSGIGVIGAGRLALATAHLCASGGHEVVLYAPNANRRRALRKRRALKSVLPEVVELHPNVTIAEGLPQLAEASRLVFVLGGHAQFDEVVLEAGTVLDGSHQIVHANHLLHGESLETTSAVIRRLTCCLQVGAIAGPVHVGELLAGQANAVVVGSPFPELVERVKAAFTQPSLRVYSRDDLVGVEVAAALVQIIAVAVGVSGGLGLGAATHATLMVRGLAEVTRMGVKLGGSRETFAGLSGLGRLLDWARPEDANYEVGRALAQGTTGKALLESVSAKSAMENGQGIHLVAPVHRWAEKKKVWAPITRVLAAVAAGNFTAREAFEELLRTEVPSED